MSAVEGGVDDPADHGWPLEGTVDSLAFIGESGLWSVNEEFDFLRENGRLEFTSMGDVDIDPIAVNADKPPVVIAVHNDTFLGGIVTDYDFIEGDLYIDVNEFGHFGRDMTYTETTVSAGVEGEP